MVAAVFYGPGDIRIETVPTPQVGPGDVLVRVRVAAICGTDLRIFASGFTKPDAGASGKGRILGHELAGDVEEVGEGVTGFSRGDRVTVAPNIGCGTCPECVRGLGHLCADYKAIGVSLDGGFAEYVLFPREAVANGNVCKIPESVSYEEAAVNEALACCYNGFQACRTQPGDTVVVIGAGPIGALHVLLSKLAGAREVIVSDVVEDRLASMESLGADLTVNAGKRDLAQAVKDRTRGRGADVVIVACSSAEAQQQALELAAVEGRVNFFGGLPRGKENVVLNTNLIHYKQLLVTGTTRSSIHQFRKTLEILASGRLDIKPVITGRIGLREIAAALSGTRDGKRLKTVVVP
ncbi:MAG: zinc-dependent dehydrogenase [Firmicutes bacterium]|nr:zinc-dependent dehydrogenase [Bacillota bacterium]MDH7494743.1 zinc-dependent dehydrogenase [Bacillota bacterium]